MLFFRGIGSIFSLLQPSPTNAGYHRIFPSEKWRGTGWLFSDDHTTSRRHERRSYSPRALWDRGRTFLSRFSAVRSTLARLWPILRRVLPFVVYGAKIVILLHLPAYHHGRALHVIQGLSDGADSDSQLRAWEQLIRPLVEEWKNVCVLATVISAAALAMFQIFSFSSNPILAGLVYLTVVCTMMAILLSFVVIVYLGGETTDPQFIRTWLGEFRSTDHHSLWSVWVIVSLPSVWTGWGALVFISSVILLFWSKSGATTTADTVLHSLLTKWLDVRSFLTGVTVLGVFNIACVVFSFWRQGRRRSTPLENIAMENRDLGGSRPLQVHLTDNVSEG